MAQAGVYAPGAVIAAEVEVRVEGVLRPHVSMDWAGDTTGGLPAQVVSAGTGMKSRTGTILWAPDRSVLADPPHPLRQSAGWPPREGDELVIDATVDTGQGPYTWRRFTGRLGRTTGSLTDGTLTSEVTDTLGDALRAMVTVPPIVADARHYMRSYWVAYQALAQAGLTALPAPDQYTVLWNGYQGGLRPLVGEFAGSGIRYDVGDLDGWSGSWTSPDGTARAGLDVLVSGRGGAGSSSVEVLMGGHYVSLAFSSGVLTFKHSGLGTIWSGPYVGVEKYPILAFQLMGNAAWVFTSPSTWVTANLAVPTGDPVSLAGGDRVTGVSVRYLPSAAGPGVVARTASHPVTIRRSLLEQERIIATRGVENVTARAVVDSWSGATLASYWMDELGAPRVFGRDRLLDQAVVRTVLLDERVFAGSWSVGDDSVHSRVVVNGEQGLVELRSGDRVLIYQERSARSFDSSAVIERFIEAPAEEEWGPVDLTAQHAVATTVAGGLPSRGTWIYGVTSSDDYNSTEDWIWSNTYPGGDYDIVIERLGQRTLKVTETVTPPTGRHADLKAPDEDMSSELRHVYRNTASPVIRGAWKSTWTDYTLTATQTGPTWAPTLTHDAGWWLTSADAQRVADALATEVTEAMVTLSRVEVLWDPTRQIGDVEEWVATDAAGAESWRARVLVTGYAEAWDGNVPSQSVDVRVISLTDPTSGKTYADLAQAYATYGDMTGTYQQVYDALPEQA